MLKREGHAPPPDSAARPDNAASGGGRAERVAAEEPKKPEVRKEFAGSEDSKGSEKKEEVKKGYVDRWKGLLTSSSGGDR